MSERNEWEGEGWTPEQESQPWTPESDNADALRPIRDASKLFADAKQYLKDLEDHAVKSVIINWEELDKPEVVAELDSAREALKSNPTASMEDRFMIGVALYASAPPDAPRELVESIGTGLDELAVTLAKLYQLRHVVATIDAIKAI